jgi:hypothetical protein
LHTISIYFFFAGGGGGATGVSWWNTATHLPFRSFQTVDA